MAFYICPTCGRGASTGENHVCIDPFKLNKFIEKQKLQKQLTKVSVKNIRDMHHIGTEKQLETIERLYDQEDVR